MNHILVFSYLPPYVMSYIIGELQGGAYIFNGKHTIWDGLKPEISKFHFARLWVCNDGELAT